ncbi:MAG: non-canonical purine NTP pyrophosphatase [Bryobacterales bacterium]|nr:non-canonical purine NTP pyrophosphatase [Bryobacterales bacterium]
MILYCATGNRGKLREFQQAAGDGIEVRAFGPLECPETGDTFEANAVQKALCYARALKAETGRDELLFCDDSGIEVDALGGAPGVYSARFAGPGATDEANNALLLERLRNTPPEQRTARYVCVIALVRGEQLLETFRATAEGVIQDQAAGEGGFGYDPYFLFPSLGRTFAELDPAEKWIHSHRGKAFRAMLASLD